MSVIQGLQNLVAFTRVTRNSPVQEQKPVAALSPEAKSDFLRARTELLNLYRDIERLAELANINTRFKIDLPDARSSSSLGLDLTETAAFLDSADDINAAPMSFSPFGPAWTDGSSSLLTIGGEYLGNNGTGTLTFEVRRPGTRGVNDIRIRVDSSTGGPTRNFTVDRDDPLDQQYDLGNGLFFTMGAGDAINRDTATIQVFDAVGAAVDPDQPLGGVRNQNPNFEFGMPSIVDGSFELNGETINVSIADTLNDVLQQINTSDAGVTAVFNPVTERVDITQNTPGSVPTIDLQNDTSNLLQAAKLDSLNVIPGTDREDVQAFDAVAEFSSVSSGNIVINGQQIALDTANDSLSTMLDKINSSSAGVVATFDPASQLVTIEAEDNTSVLELSSNGTGFFGAINMLEGRLDPEAVSNGISRRRSYEIADAAEAVFERLSRLFQDSTFVGKGANAGGFRSPFESVIGTAFDGATSGDILGFLYDSGSGARQRGEYVEIDRRDLTSNLQRRGNLVRDFLAGKDEEGGFVHGLLFASEQALNAVNGALGLSGTFVDTFA